MRTVKVRVQMCEENSARNRDNGKEIDLTYLFLHVNSCIALYITSASVM